MDKEPKILWLYVGSFCIAALAIGVDITLAAIAVLGLSMFTYMIGWCIYNALLGRIQTKIKQKGIFK